LLRDGFRFEYTKKKVVCQEKATTRYGRILLICSSARPKKERGRVGSEEKVSADDYHQIVHTLPKYWIVDFRKEASEGNIVRG
jgi:hypothetical protein